VSDVNGLVRSLRDWSKGDLAQRFGWIIGYGYDDSRLREQRPLTRQDLDAVSADKPVLVIHHSGRQVVANSRALELAGITRDSVSPPAGSIGRWPGSKSPTACSTAPPRRPCWAPCPSCPPTTARR
jgi:predicted amidohydrolase YtcJ